MFLILKCVLSTSPTSRPGTVGGRTSKKTGRSNQRADYYFDSTIFYVLTVKNYIAIPSHGRCVIDGIVTR